MLKTIVLQRKYHTFALQKRCYIIIIPFVYEFKLDMNIEKSYLFYNDIVTIQRIIIRH